MPRGRARRRSVTVGYGKAFVRYEWTGFRDAGATGNLDTSTLFELVPPDGPSAVVNLFPRIRRVVGDLSFQSQGSNVTNTPIGIMLRMSNVGADQTIDSDVSPLSTDPDEFHNARILWWRTHLSLFPASSAAAEWDTTALHYPIDIKLNRKMQARDTLVLRIDAGTTGRMRVSVNLRCLIQVHGR